MRFDVNLSILFTELPLLERPAAAAAAGFDAVELWWPFAGPCPADREIDALRRAIDDAGVRLVGLNFDAGDMAAGDRGLLSRPDDSARFRANIDVAVGPRRARSAAGCSTPCTATRATGWPRTPSTTWRCHNLAWRRRRRRRSAPRSWSRRSTPTRTPATRSPPPPRPSR